MAPIKRSALRLTSNLLNSFDPAQDYHNQSSEIVKFLRFYIQYSYKLEFDESNGKETYVFDETRQVKPSNDFWRGKISLNIIMKSGKEDGPMFCKAFFNH